MIVAKFLLAALGLSAYAVAQDQDGQEQDDVVILDSWPMDPNNVQTQAGGPVTIRWDVRQGRDFQYTYDRGYCYSQTRRWMQGYTIWADRDVSVDTWEEYGQTGQKWSPPLKGSTGGNKVKWGPHPVGSLCIPL